jgi:hypothetical protein
MARINKSFFIESIQNQIEQQKGFASVLLNSTEQNLNKKLNVSSWSILECIEHMNLSMQIYTDQFKNVDLKNNDENEIKISWLGNYFAEGMRPKNDSIPNKIKTMKKLAPSSNLNHECIFSFISRLEFIEHFMNSNSTRNFNKTKVNTAIGSLVKLNIGEALNFVLAHNERHIWQVNKILTVCLP